MDLILVDSERYVRDVVKGVVSLTPIPSTTSLEIKSKEQGEDKVIQGLNSDYYLVDDGTAYEVTYENEEQETEVGEIEVEEVEEEGMPVEGEDIPNPMTPEEEEEVNSREPTPDIGPPPEGEIIVEESEDEIRLVPVYYQLSEAELDSIIESHKHLRSCVEVSTENRNELAILELAELVSLMVENQGGE